ncbi:hypothetical protein KSC_081370 [Ktedonobacter sp. SOSP1-52]|nr:hypothetical protein KSC_081370 [Ktedonobacter sp. SOSP1-52]
MNIVGAEYRESPTDSRPVSGPTSSNMPPHEPRQPGSQPAANPGQHPFDKHQVVETPRPAIQVSSHHYNDYPGDSYQEPVYREHVSGYLGAPYRPPFPPTQAGQPNGQVHQPYQPQAAHNGAYGAQQPYAPHAPYNPYAPASYAQPHYYYGQVPYGYPYTYGYPYGYYVQPEVKEPGRTYQLTMGIITLIASALAFLGGLFCVLMLVLTSTLETATSNLPADQRFASISLFTALAFAGIIGGAACGYHSIRALLRKQSWAFKLPQFWIFLALYVVLIGIAIAMSIGGVATASIPLTLFLIALAGVFPALTVASLAIRHIRKPKTAPWPTTWRRFIVAMVSGATISIVLASVLELLLEVVVRLVLGTSSSILSNPDQLPSDPRSIIALLVTLSIIAPLVEEAVKPLAAITMLGRMRSAAEAFVMGMGCGIGFGLVETVMYISTGYQDWLQVALLRSSACLLHGFGAGMVSLGWYYLTHKNSTKKYNRILLGIGCGAYAVLQHAIWNGSTGLELLPFFPKDNFQLGTFSLSPEWAIVPVYVVLSALMIAFLLFVTRRLRTQNSQSTPKEAQPQQQPQQAWNAVPQPARVS